MFRKLCFRAFYPVARGGGRIISILNFMKESSGGGTPSRRCTASIRARGTQENYSLLIRACAVEQKSTCVSKLFPKTLTATCLTMQLLRSTAFAKHHVTCHPQIPRGGGRLQSNQSARHTPQFILWGAVRH